MRERLKAADSLAARETRNTSRSHARCREELPAADDRHLWREHLVDARPFAEVIGRRGLAQRDPLNEYKSEAFALFDALITRLREIVTAQLMRVEVSYEPPPQSLPEMQATHIDPLSGEDEMSDR